MQIQKADIHEHEILTQVTKASKAYWGYPPAQIEAWSEELTITALYIQSNTVYTLKNETAILGYYSYCKVEPQKVCLDNLFVLPEHIGKGYGKLLMDHFVGEAKRKGIVKVVLDSEPKAEAFYRKWGFKVIGQLQSSIKDRFLPVMELDLFD